LILARRNGINVRYTRRSRPFAGQFVGFAQIPAPARAENAFAAIRPACGYRRNDADRRGPGHCAARRWPGWATRILAGYRIAGYAMVGDRLRRGGGRADTRPVIGAAFSVTLASAQGGDDIAFACLFRDVQPALLRYLHVITPDAEDVAGETWLQVVKGLPGFRGGEEAFRAWLFTIARHRAVDAGRSRSRRPDVPLDLTEALEQQTVPDAADLAMEAISTRWVLALVKKLPRDHAEIVILRVVAGLEAADVARIVGKTPGAVRVTAHRALRRLAELAELAGVTH
jgi:RNA polymerase sigma-70 factor, ECF subfamily